MNSNEYHLSWNDFESNLSLAFRKIRDEKEFFDCTLSCGSRQIPAHKIILSACSPVLRSILKQNPHQHPLLYLKGVQFKDLEPLLNFMYHGSVNVALEDLNSFLAVAKELQVKGLTVSNSEEYTNTVKHKQPPDPIAPTETMLQGRKEAPTMTSVTSECKEDGLIPLVKTEPAPETPESSFSENPGMWGFDYSGYEGYDAHFERGGSPSGIGSSNKKPKMMQGICKPKTKETLSKDITEPLIGLTGGSFIENKAKRSRKVKAYLESLAFTGTALNSECGYGVILVAAAVLPKCGPRGRGLNIMLPDRDGREPEINFSRTQPIPNNKETTNLGSFPDYFGMQPMPQEIKSEVPEDKSKESVCTSSDIDLPASLME